MLVVNNNPKDLIALREAFRKHRLRRPHILCTVGWTIDEFENLTLKESAFLRLLALESDSECEELYKARELVAVFAFVNVNGTGRML